MSVCRRCAVVVRVCGEGEMNLIECVCPRSGDLDLIGYARACGVGVYTSGRALEGERGGWCWAMGEG